MAGQFIKLSGVTAAATAGAPRIVVSAADAAAMRVPSLIHSVSASQLTGTAAGVSGRCRKSGKSLVPKGTAAALQLRTVAGHVGIGLSSAASAGLALPAGSATPSYTAVVTLQISAAEIALATPPVGILTTCTAADAASATVLRYYGSAATTNPDRLATFGSDTLLSGAAIVQRPAGEWVVAVVDFNDNTMQASIGMNGGSFVTTQKSTHHAPGAGGYFEIGYHLSSSGLRGSMVGELYLFSDSLLSTPLGQSQLAAVIAGLKADYGIA